MGEGRARSGRFLAVGFALVVGVLLVMPVLGAAGPVSFTTPRVMGYPSGDDWEPAVASDGAGNVYLVITHFGGVPGCGSCGKPSMLVQVSHDGGKTFSASAPLTVNAASQYDPEVKINDAGDVYVSYLLGKDTVVQKSTDRGSTWSSPVAVNTGIKNSWTDKDGLAVRGDDVYVGFNIAQRLFVASSHDGGQTFSSVQINSNTIGWTLNGGATIDSRGSVYMVWEAYHQSGNARGLIDVLVTKSADRGATWTISYVDMGLPPGPGCSAYSCGWAYLGTGAQIAVDGADKLYVLYNAPTYDQGPPYVWLRVSKDGGATWGPRTTVSADGSAAFHVFPAIDAGAAGDVRVSWMDNRTGAFNVWYRSSSDGGQSWSSEVRVSAYRRGYAYVTADGFAFPYGDYFILDLDPKGVVHLAWGEAPDYIGPGNVLYAHS